MIKPKISKPNSKTRIESFNINNSVCQKIKGCLKQDCLKHCYYNKIKRMYPQQEPFLNNNLEATKSENFFHLMLEAIHKLNIRYFRIHTCGEFYSQKYFNDWTDIARHFPEITFFTYTKNINLNVERPKNFILYLSDDKGIWTEHYNKFDGISRIKDKNEPVPKGFKQCLNQTMKLTCIECKLCTKKGNVCFNKH